MVLVGSASSLTSRLPSLPLPASGGPGPYLFLTAALLFLPCLPPVSLSLCLASSLCLPVFL